MQQINDTLLEVCSAIANFCWSNIMIYIMFGMGIFFTIRFGFPQIRHFKDAVTLFVNGFKNRDDGHDQKHEMSSLQAVLTAIGGQIGVGNIAGPATAILAGGPGAVFWLWVSAFFGMGTISAEATAAQMYREVLPDGSVVGGPAVYIRKAFGDSGFSKFMGGFEAVLCIVGYGMACALAQGNTLAGAMENSFHVPNFVTGIIVAAIVLYVSIAGMKGFASVIEKMVPFMAVIYFVTGIIVLLCNITRIPAAFGMIFAHAFSTRAVVGGAVGFTVKQAIRYGVARGLFSNEAGQGSTAHAHAVAKVKHPCDQGLIAMMSIVIDTFIILTISALIILTTGANTIEGIEGVQLVQHGFTGVFGNIGGMIVAFCIMFFCLSTILSGYFVGSQNWKTLFNGKYVKAYDVIILITCVLGTLTYVEVVWSICDCLNGPMVIVNLIALLGVQGKLAQKWREYNEGGDKLDTSLNDAKRARAK